MRWPRGSWCAARAALLVCSCHSLPLRVWQVLDDYSANVHVDDRIFSALVSSKRIVIEVRVACKIYLIHSHTPAHVAVGVRRGCPKMEAP